MSLSRYLDADQPLTIVAAPEAELPLKAEVTNDQIRDLLLNAHMPDTTQFKVLEDHHAHLIELKDLEATLLGQGTISQEAARMLVEVIPELTDHIALNAYTETPTRVGYDETRQIVTDYQARESTGYYNDLCRFMEKAVEDIQLFHDNLVQYYSKFTATQIVEMESQYRDLWLSLQASKNTILPRTSETGEKSFFDVLREPLINLSVPDLPQVDTELFKAALVTIHEVLNNTEFTIFLIQLAESGEYDFDLGIQPLARKEHLALIDIIGIYAEHHLQPAMDQLLLDYDKHLRQLSEVALEIKGLAPDNTDQDDYQYVSDNALLIAHAIEHTTRIANLYKTMALFSSGLNLIFGWLAKLSC